MAYRSAIPGLFFLRLFSILFLLILSCQMEAASPDFAQIQSIRIREGSQSDFLISANHHFQFYMFAKKNPDRLVIDIRPARLSFPISAVLAEQHPDVNRIQAQQFDRITVRIVFDLKHAAKYSALSIGNDLRVRIVGKQRGPQSAPQQVQAAPPATGQSSSDVQMSISTLDKQQQKKAEGKNEEEEGKGKKSRVKMSGYLVDRFRRNVVRGEDSDPSMTHSYALAMKYRKNHNNSIFRINYEVVGHEFMSPLIDDYMSHDLKIGYEWNLGSNLSFKTVGRAELDDYLGDRFGVRPALEYQINPDSAVVVYGGHVTKVYRDYRDRMDQDRFFGIEYMRKVGNHRLELRYQRNYNDSEKKRQDYILSRYTLSYNIPWTKRFKTQMRVDYSPKQYMNRFIEYEDLMDSEYGILRLDERWTFAISSRFTLGQHFEIVPRYSLQDRYSNDPLIEETILHIPSIALRGRW